MRSRSSSVHDHFGTYYFGTDLDISLWFGIGFCHDRFMGCTVAYSFNYIVEARYRYRYCVARYHFEIELRPMQDRPANSHFKFTAQDKQASCMSHE